MTAIREISCPVVTDAVKQLFLEANTTLREEVLAVLEKARKTEISELDRHMLTQILENTAIAKESAMPLCQDTGFAVVFLEIGQDVHLVEGDLYEAVREGVRLAYADGYLRKSICDPLSRDNTQNKLPAVIHADIVPGNRLKIIAMPKGGGSENMSWTAMLVPEIGRASRRERV